MRIEFCKFSSTQSWTAAGSSGTGCSSAADSVASAMLIAGPAAATQTMSRRGLSRRLKSTGTGFAQPKTKLLNDSSSAGMTSVP